MTTTAIIMMIVAILVVWGGLAVAIVYLMRHPLEEDTHGDFLDEPEAHHL